jgi:hypothetical protein
MQPSSVLHVGQVLAAFHRVVKQARGSFDAAGICMAEAVIAFNAASRANRRRSGGEGVLDIREWRSRSD